MLEVGQQAPEFSVLDDADFEARLVDYKGNRNVLLYFYPKDDTPGCTIESKQFTTLINEFTAQETVIYGISKDDVASHKNFIEKYNLEIGLLADTDGKMCGDYGVWQEKEKNGKTVMGIVRSTFFIDKEGVLKIVEYGVRPDGHALAMLEKIKQL